MKIVQQKGFVPNFLVILRKCIIVVVEFTSTFATSEILVLIYLLQTSLKNIKPWAYYPWFKCKNAKEELNSQWINFEKANWSLQKFH